MITFRPVAEAMWLTIPILNMISRVRIQQMATWDKVKMVEIKKIMFIYNCLIFKSLIDTSTIVKLFRITMGLLMYSLFRLS
jgi:hypothetical protein